MSLTYDQLKTEVAAYLKRDDLTSQIPNFITMGENELNRRLDLVQMEEATSFTLGAAASTVAFSSISAACVAVLKLWKVVNGVVEELVYLEPLQFLQQRAVAANTGQPNYWTVQGGAIVQFDRVADQAYTIHALIRKKFAVATDYATNWVALNAQDAYVFASLLQAEPFIKNDKRIGTWRAMLESVILQLEEADTKFRASRNTILIPDAAGVVGARGHYNINAG